MANKRSKSAGSPERTLLSQLKSAARTTPSLIAQGVEPEIISSRKLIRFPFSLTTGDAVAYLRIEDETLVLKMRAFNKASKQALRRVLLGAARLVPLPNEHHVLATFDQDTAPKRIMKSVAAWIQTVTEEAELRQQLGAGEKTPGENDVYGFWADVRSNFGDQIGPWLVQELTGRRMINSRYSKIDHGRMTATVGSIIHMLPTSATSEAEIWGAGLMRKLGQEEREGLEKISSVTVHAVRGKLTRELLIEQLGWDVPEIYGDPALLCPRFYTPEPRPQAEGKISFVPHFKHIEHHASDAAAFQTAVDTKTEEAVHVVDVHGDLRDVISQIAASKVCISSSLHGIIIAQAYGVPWVWLYAPDRNIGGARFKFDDFFSTLADPETVASHSASVDEFLTLPFAQLAEQAALPALGIDLDALQNAFPLQSAKNPVAPLQPRFRWNKISAEERFMADVRAAYRIAHP